MMFSALLAICRIIESAIVAFALHDAYALLPRVQDWLLSAASHRLPKPMRQDLLDQWHADLEEVANVELFRTLLAANTLFRAARIRDAFAPPFIGHLGCAALACLAASLLLAVPNDILIAHLWEHSPAEMRTGNVGIAYAAAAQIVILEVAFGFIAWMARTDDTIELPMRLLVFLGLGTMAFLIVNTAVDSRNLSVFLEVRAHQLPASLEVFLRKFGSWFALPMAVIGFSQIALTYCAMNRWVAWEEARAAFLRGTTPKGYKSFLK